ncbi:hypothetical protein [Nocardioides alkalitolerans]|uniref:hypothetical protein n=1 Tax=Nocardioides alkalitolerans TaxID=281714 RepID=UPI000411F064|nr:hypothetical protein [Nocardioides alkalitolerans]
MSAGFHVEVGHLAGFGAMTAVLHEQLLSCSAHVDEARPGGGYEGLMSALVSPMGTLCDGITSRVGSRGELVGGLRDTLTVTAWDYNGTDASVYTEVTFIPVAGPGVFETAILDFPDAVAYDTGTDPALPVPAHEEADIQALLDEVGGSIKVVDWAVREVTGWSPVETIVDPLAGNWTELTRAATVLEQFGAGSEQVAANLTAPLARLSEHWQGGAATDFESYLIRLAAAIEIEGPIHRLVAYVLKEIAGEFEAVAEYMVTTLKSAVDKIATSIATGWVPFVGWYKVYEAVMAVIEILTEAKNLIDELDALVDQVVAVLDAAQDPVGFVQDQAADVLAPYLGGAEVAQDLARLDPSDLEDAPDDPYSVGTDPHRAS